MMGGRPYRLSDDEVAVFLQDGWEPVPGVRLDAGVRGDWQRLSGPLRIAPRAGVAWMPSETARTVLRGGFGWFYDRVPPIVYAFPYYPMRAGAANVLEQVHSGPLVFGRSGFAPHSRTATIEADQPLEEWLVLHAGHRETWSSGQLVVRPGANRLAISGDGVSRVRQTELTAKLSWYAEQDWNISYVHSSGSGTLEPFLRAVGDFPAPVIRPAIDAPLPDVVPHRFLSWGVFPLRHGLRFSPMIEWRTGFPYSALDLQQQYAGVPNTRYLPPFFSFDWRISKDIPVRGHKVRLSFSMFNTTNHGNFDAVRLNVADPQFGEFLGLRSRRFRLDFDWLY
jgi:hypothetical protein